MFDENMIFRKGLVQVIDNLHRAGIEDITTEIVQLRRGKHNVRFRFHTEEQWTSNPANVANKATQLMGKTHKGIWKMPDHLIVHEGVNYFVVIV